MFPERRKQQRSSTAGGVTYETRQRHDRFLHAEGRLGHAPELISQLVRGVVASMTGTSFGRERFNVGGPDLFGRQEPPVRFEGRRFAKNQGRGNSDGVMDVKPLSIQPCAGGTRGPPCGNRREYGCCDRRQLRGWVSRTDESSRSARPK